MLFRLALQRAKVPFEQNYSGFHLAQPDFYLKQYSIVVEVDGAYWHRTPKQKQRDVMKDRFYRGLGLKVWRFPEAEVVKNPDACVARMLKSVRRT